LLANIIAMLFQAFGRAWHCHGSGAYEKSGFCMRNLHQKNSSFQYVLTAAGFLVLYEDRITNSPTMDIIAVPSNAIDDGSGTGWKAFATTSRAILSPVASP
jgi:hypothetical protein